MSALRDEIRAILREELAAFRGDAGAVVETVRIDSSGDLNRFVADLLTRADEPDFRTRVASGQIRFELGKPTPYAARAIVSSPPKPAGPMLDKKLVTEIDIAALGPGTLRLAKHSRLTPLAKDEARRKGIRIERIET
ncbi:hypothetical protein B7H23_10955 [Notoacmeibacter marinus]|uniref:Uncharacterized protein n=1 Tax=Notoacmeibacter marinus TaxID=1876515 RepID=A0A231UXD3_9HYPH|nr:hypothetical protein [Notoacmeibacter marinus]OXT00613.1 hypothetical protein B7H23_10955 [Notoacmeibacter marinus]